MSGIYGANYDMSGIYGANYDRSGIYDANYKIIRQSFISIVYDFPANRVPGKKSMTILLTAVVS